KCNACRHIQQTTTMTIVDGPCWKCHSTMKTAFVAAGNERNGSHVGPDEFTKQELEIAKNKGVILENRYDKFSRTRQPANKCVRCGTFAEDYRYSFITKCLDTSYRSKNFDVDYHCDNCAKIAYEKSLSA